MVDWEVTATTIYCEAVQDEVTLIVKSDGLTKCTGLQKYERPGKEAAKELKQKSKAAGKTLKCLGSACEILGQYREKTLGKQS